MGAKSSREIENVDVAGNRPANGNREKPISSTQDVPPAKSIANGVNARRRSASRSDNCSGSQCSEGASGQSNGQNHKPGASASLKRGLSKSVKDEDYKASPEERAANQPGHERTVVVGYAFMAKKMDTMARVVMAGVQEGVEFRALDLTKDLRKQGQFDVLLHKLSEDVMFRECKSLADRRLCNIESYLRANTGTAIVDPISNVGQVINRAKTLDVLRDTYARFGGPEGGAPKPPRYVVVGAGRTGPAELGQVIADAGLRFPLICKPIEACGTHGSHTLLLVFDASGLAAVKVPTVVQEYSNHNGRLFKVCVLGEEMRVHERASLPNLPTHLTGSFSFDSQKPYPSVQDFGCRPGEEVLPACQPVLAAERARAAAVRLRAAFGLTIFGFDLIVASESEEVIVIDVNYFPSFRDLDDFPEVLRKHLRETAWRSWERGASAQFLGNGKDHSRRAEAP